MARLRSKIGVGAMALGVALMVVGVFAGGASAQEQEGVVDDRPTCDTSGSLHFRWGLASAGDTVDENGFVNVAGLAGGGETKVANDDITVTLSDADFIDHDPAGALGPEYFIKSLHFTTDTPVSAVIARLWVGEGAYEYETVEFDDATSGDIVSPANEWTRPIKGLEFCYEVAEVAPTSVTAAPTSVTAAPTTAAAPTTVAGQEVEVLPQVVTAPTQAQAQLAFSGSESRTLALLGGGFVLAGMFLVGLDRVGLVRRGQHTR